MKKSDMEALRNYANTDPNFPADLRDAVNTEWEHNTEKSRANTALYAAAHDVVMACAAWDKPMMVKELWPLVETMVPANFSMSKLQYALREKWKDEVCKHDNGKEPFKYSRK